MSMSSMARSTPLEGAPKLLPLARALLDALGLDGVALPTEEQFSRASRHTPDAGDARVSLDRYTPGVDPYGGGPSDIQTLWVERAPDRRLEVSIREIAWVGPELVVAASGPPPWVDAVAATVDAFIAEHARVA